MTEPPPIIPPASLAVSSWCWASDYYDGRFSLLDLPHLAAGHGFHQVEANDFMLPPPRLSRLRRPLTQLIPGANPEQWRYQKKSIEKFQAALVREGVRCIAWTLNTDFARGDIDQLGERLYLRWGLRVAQMLRVPRLRIITGGQAEDPITEKMVGRATAFVQKGLERLPQGEVVLENHWGISTDIDKHLSFFLRVKKPLPAAVKERFSLCIDPLNTPSDQQTEMWDKLAPYGGHVHLKIIQGARPGPSNGSSWTNFVQTIYRHQPHYRGYFVIEDSRLFNHPLLSRIAASGSGSI